MKALSILLAVVALLPAGALAKGEGVGVWMEGRVSEVRRGPGSIHLVVSGRFWFEQHRGTEPSVIEVSKATIPATLAQGEPFFAMTKDWGGGAIRKQGALLQILQAAAASGNVVRFQLINARLKFGPQGTIAVEDADVIRATDHSLR